MKVPLQKCTKEWRIAEKVFDRVEVLRLARVELRSDRL